MNYMNYTDDNLSKLMKDKDIDIFDTKDENDIFNYIYELIPNWIISKSDSYTIEYNQLQRNWYYLCSTWEVEQKHILIVEFLPNLEEGFDNYKALLHIVNILTHSGYIVRNHSELCLCKKCNRAMLTERAFNHFKGKSTNNIFINKWNDTCVGCNKI